MPTTSESRDGLAALIFHNVSPLFKLAIKLGRRFLGVHMPIEIARDYPTAMRRALEILDEEGIEGLPSLEPESVSPRQGETGALDLDHYHALVPLVDGHIVHGRSSGFIGLREMERQLEFENMVSPPSILAVATR